MTRFNSDDHWAALRACWDATDFGAITSGNDINNLNRAASAFASAEPETLSRAAFATSLAAVRASVDLAKAKNPEAAALVTQAREAKRLAAMSEAARQKAVDDAAQRAVRLAEKAAANAALEQKIGFEKLAIKLKTEHPDEYAVAYTIARSECERISDQTARPRINVRIGQTISESRGANAAP